MFFVAALFFFKFWKVSRNRFFAFFAGAFGLFSLERIVLLVLYIATSPEASYQKVESVGWVYLFRLVGFILILIAIVDRNQTKLSHRKNQPSRG